MKENEILKFQNRVGAMKTVMIIRVDSVEQSLSLSLVSVLFPLRFPFPTALNPTHTPVKGCAEMK
ncbi:hypothetical protein AHAS_Ahas01G0061500 [Arachis hypogaea]